MADLVPHPLVTRVGLGLLDQSDVTFSAPVTTAADRLNVELSSAVSASRVAAQIQAAQVAQTGAEVAKADWAKAQGIADSAAEEAKAAQSEADAAGRDDARKQELDDAAAKAIRDAEDAEAEADRKHAAADEAEKAADDAKALADEARATLPSRSTSLSGNPASFDPIDVDDLHLGQKEELAAALANKADLPDLTLFAGFLGGQVNRGDDGLWRLVYLDSRLYSWLLVREYDIVVHQRLADDRAPSGLRDVLWIRGTANVIQGTGARSNEGRFLVGEFTRAGDFAASTTGGTFSAASGLVCEATTPGCCTARRTG